MAAKRILTPLFLVGAVQWGATVAFAQSPIAVGEGYFQTNDLGAALACTGAEVNRCLPDPSIERDQIAISDSLRTSSVAIPSSGWFSTFLQTVSFTGEFNQQSLVANPLMYGFPRLQLKGRDTSGLQFGLPDLQVDKSANQVLPVLFGTLPTDLEVLYGKSLITNQNEPDFPEKIELTSFDDILSMWTATTKSGSGALTLTAMQGSPFAFFKVDNFPVGLVLGGTNTQSKAYPTGLADIDARLFFGGKKAYILFFENMASPNMGKLTQDGSNPIFSLTFGANQMGIGHFTIAALPFGTSDGMLTAAQDDFIKTAMLPLAFNVPQSTDVAYNYDPTVGILSTTFSIETKNVLTNATGGDTLFALLPHHYTDVATTDGKTPLGQTLLDAASAAKLVSGDSNWSTRADAWNVNSFAPATNTPYDNAHANPYLLYDANSVFYYTMWGPMLLTKGAGVTIRQPVIGLLPWFVLPDDTMDNLRNLTFEQMQKALLFQVANTTLNNLSDFRFNFNQGGVNDGSRNSYGDGVQLAAWTDTAIVTNQLGVESNKESYAPIFDFKFPETTLTATEVSLKKYFTQDPSAVTKNAPDDIDQFTAWGELDKSFWRFHDFDESLNVLLTYPSGFGSTRFLNDHNLTYGYHLHAANVLSGYSPFNMRDFLKYGADGFADAIDQVAYDIGNPFTQDAQHPPAGGDAGTYVCANPGQSAGLCGNAFTPNNRLLAGAGRSSFPMQRNFDAYSGVSWASGPVPAGRDKGPNTESVSEALQAAAHLMQRGAMTGNQSLFIASMAQWVTMIAASNAYWMDMDGYYLSFADFRNMANPPSGMGTFGTVVAPMQAAQSSFFDKDHLQAVRGIIVFPIGPQSFYLSKNKAYMKRAYDDMAAFTNNASAASSLWNVVMTEWEAAFDPAAAAKDLDNAFKGLITFKGGSAMGPASNRDPIDISACLSAMRFSNDAANCGATRGLFRVAGDTYLKDYRWVRFLDHYGTADFTHTANTPFALVLNKGGVKHFAAYNPRDSEQAVTFYDSAGAPVPNLQNKMLAGKTLQIYDASGNATLKTPTLLFATEDSTLRKESKATNEGVNARLFLNSGGGGAGRPVIGFDAQEIMDAVDALGSDFKTATLILTIAENGNDWTPDEQDVHAVALLDDFEEGNGQDEGLDKADQMTGAGEGVTWSCAVDPDVSDNKSSDCLVDWVDGPGAGDPTLATAAAFIHHNDMARTVAFDVTEDVINRHSGWVIMKDKDNGNGEARYYSREGAAARGDPRLAPVLVIQ